MSPYGISYEARAEECRRRAAEANWPPDRQEWTELAQAWLRLTQSTDVRSVPGAIFRVIKGPPDGWLNRS
jgi:hypothetical protein